MIMKSVRPHLWSEFSSCFSALFPYVCLYISLYSTPRNHHFPVSVFFVSPLFFSLFSVFFLWLPEGGENPEKVREKFKRKMNEPPKYAYPYPAQGGYYQGPPVMAPPQYAAAPPPRREPGFLEGCLAALCCCCLLDECCCDPTIIFY